MENKYLEDFWNTWNQEEGFWGKWDDIDGMNLQQMLATYKAEWVSDVNKLLELYV